MGASETVCESNVSTPSKLEYEGGQSEGLEGPVSLTGGVGGLYNPLSLESLLGRVEVVV